MQQQEKSPAIRPSSPTNPDCKDPTDLATADGQKAANEDGFHKDKGLVTFIDNLFG